MNIQNDNEALIHCHSILMHSAMYELNYYLIVFNNNLSTLCSSEQMKVDNIRSGSEQTSLVNKENKFWVFFFSFLLTDRKM